MTETVDIAIVGGGPAGSAAAITAAARGARVAVIDRARFPRDKCCGDGLTTTTLRELESLAFDPTSLPSFVTVDELVLDGDWGGRAVLPLGGAAGIAAAVCRRVELDAALLDSARDAGATVREGDAFVALDANGEPSTLTLASGSTLRAGAVIAADGGWSTVRRCLPGATARRAEPQHWHAYRTYISDVSHAASHQLLVAFDKELLPGYAWSFPLGDGHANVGVCLARSQRVAGGELARQCEEVLSGPLLSSFLGPAARRDAPLRSWPIPAPLGSLPLTGADGRVLFVGDAARAADSFTGEGIAQALATGRAAGRVLTEGTPPDAATRYEDEIKATLALDARIANWCNRLMGSELANRTAIGAGRLNGRLAHAIGRFLYEDFPRGDLLRPSRWGAISRPAPLPFRELAQR